MLLLLTVLFLQNVSGLNADGQETAVSDPAETAVSDPAEEEVGLEYRHYNKPKYSSDLMDEPLLRRVSIEGIWGPPLGNYHLHRAIGISDRQCNGQWVKTNLRGQVNYDFSRRDGWLACNGVHPIKYAGYDKIEFCCPYYPFTRQAKKCDRTDKTYECNKNAAKLKGNGVCDLTACGNCPDMWDWNTFDGGDCGFVKWEAPVGQKKCWHDAPNQCYGLKQKSASSADECGKKCVDDPSCETYQYGTDGRCYMGKPSRCDSSPSSWKVAQGEKRIVCDGKERTKLAAAEAESLAIAEGATNTGPGVLINGLAFFGFGVVVYGAGNHYFKQQ